MGEERERGDEIKGSARGNEGRWLGRSVDESQWSLKRDIPRK